ncbi:MAG: hypothetical protein EVA89_28575 [Sandaracinaceae bacterium]|nr:MAG: hypothetical protein EVA89_28575 [Sandaracinaceae bacterium]
MRCIRRSPALLACFLFGCVSQLTPSSFFVPDQQIEVADLERALATQGMTPDRVDTRAGIVETPWEDTGRNSDGTTWVTRYLITLSVREGASDVTVAMDLRTCERAPLSGRVDGSSCARVPDGMTPTMYQDRLDAFAARLRTSLGGIPVSS